MSSDYKDYYTVLGIAKNASADDIKRAYRRLAKEHHPDLHAEKDKVRATERFKEINEAYAVLSDPQKRAPYDQIGPGWESARPSGPESRPREEASGSDDGGFAGFSDFFENLYGGGERGRGAPRAARGGPRRGQDVEAEMSISLEDAVAGGEKRLTLAVPALCPSCGGTGRRGGGFCPQCAGVGEIKQEKTITARLPKFVHAGTRIRLRGQGGLASGGEPGDLFVTLRLQPHPLYKIRGDDLETPVTVMPWVAALGGEAVIPSLEGPIRVKVPPGTHSGRVLRVAGKGMGREGGARGDIHGVVRIDIPEKHDAPMAALYEQMRERNA